MTTTAPRDYSSYQNACTYCRGDGRCVCAMTSGGGECTYWSDEDDVKEEKKTGIDSHIKNNCGCSRACTLCEKDQYVCPRCLGCGLVIEEGETVDHATRTVDMGIVKAAFHLSAFRQPSAKNDPSWMVRRRNPIQ